MSTRHFLSLMDMSPAELNRLLDRAIELKQLHAAGQVNRSAEGKILGMIFEKASTRTRVSFEAGMAQLGGHAMFLSTGDTQLGRGEPIADTARVISRMVDLIMIRTHGHEIAEEFAAHSRVPVINGLTDRLHPCQLLADMQTYRELRGAIQGCRVAWIGDGNNMCQTYIEAAAQWDFELAIAAPPPYRPEAAVIDPHRDRVELTEDPVQAARGAHLLVTDVWASMGQEEEQARRRRALEPYQIDHELLAHARPDALFLHCLPAHRGEEISAELLEDPRAEAIWQEAENRLHAQKALIEFLLN